MMGITKNAGLFNAVSCMCTAFCELFGKGGRGMKKGPYGLVCADG